MGLNFKTSLFGMSEKCVGNIFWFSYMFADKKEMELHELVFKIKEGLSEFCDVYPKIFGGKKNDNLPKISEYLKQVTESHPENGNLISFSSWCRFPMYEADFGWGKPIWVTTSAFNARNGIILMDTRDGDGIEVVVNMEENDMTKFEHEMELLQYASLNPTNV